MSGPQDPSGLGLELLGTDTSDSDVDEDTEQLATVAELDELTAAEELVEPTVDDDIMSELATDDVDDILIYGERLAADDAVDVVEPALPDELSVIVDEEEILIDSDDVIEPVEASDEEVLERRQEEK